MSGNLIFWGGYKIYFVLWKIGFLCKLLFKWAWWIHYLLLKWSFWRFLYARCDVIEWGIIKWKVWNAAPWSDNKNTKDIDTKGHHVTQKSKCRSTSKWGSCDHLNQYLLYLFRGAPMFFISYCWYKIWKSIENKNAIAAVMKVWILRYSFTILSFKKASSNFAMKSKACLSRSNHFSLVSMFHFWISLKNEFTSKFWGLKNKF